MQTPVVTPQSSFTAAANTIQVPATPQANDRATCNKEKKIKREKVK